MKHFDLIVGSHLLLLEKPQEAMKFLFRAHWHGSMQATATLGFVFEFGLATVENEFYFRTAELFFYSYSRLYRKASLKCDLAKIRLAFLKFHGRFPVKVDRVESHSLKVQITSSTFDGESRAIKWLKYASSRGLPSADYSLAICYFASLGTTYSAALAFQYCQQAAEKCLPPAQTLLANFYLNAIGTPRNETLALSLYIHAASNREPAAIYNIAKMFEEGIVFTTSLAQALEWYTRASYYGSFAADNTLGIFAEHSLILDNESAFNHYAKGAQSCDPFSQYNLARCYNSGIGTERNNLLALLYFERAGKQGNCEALVSAAIMYENGTQCVKSKQIAFRYYQVAGALGSNVANKRLESIFTELLLSVSRILLNPRLQTTILKSTRGFTDLPVEIVVMILGLTYYAENIHANMHMKIFHLARGNLNFTRLVHVGTENLESNRLDLCDCINSECDNVSHTILALERCLLI